MTIQEAAKILNKSVSTLQSSFPRTQRNLKEQGIILTRTGYGDNKDYTIEYTEEYESLIGKKIGKITVIEPAESVFTGGKKRGAFKCKCDCGNEVIILREKIRQGHIRSCGCLKGDDLTNQKFGKLTALSYTDERKWGSVVWNCKCDCGNECKVTSHELKNGNTQSCGCINSKGEQKIINILQENNIKYQKEKNFIDLPCLRFDFYVENKYLVEFDGIQHFQTKNSYWDTETHLQITQTNDKLKNEWCKEHNIPLIRIPYTHLKELCLEDLLLETTKWRVV